MVSTASPAAPDTVDALVDAFIARWDGTERAERANYIPFLNELCDLLGVPRPEPAKGSVGPYRFERSVIHYEADGTTTTRRIDLFKRDCFVLEAKQGASQHRTQASLFPAAHEAQHRANVRETPGWARYMLAAKGQAEGYARDLPAAEGWPPFLIVCDVGFCLDLYADFSGTGKHYAQFPPRAFVERLVLPTVMEPLRLDWDGVRAAAETATNAADVKQAAALVRDFHARLCHTRVLDPACGTGNFLYVTLELMKRLEGEVLDALAAMERGASRPHRRKTKLYARVTRTPLAIIAWTRIPAAEANAVLLQSLNCGIYLRTL